MFARLLVGMSVEVRCCWGESVMVAVVSRTLTIGALQRMLLPWCMLSACVHAWTLESEPAPCLKVNTEVVATCMNRLLDCGSSRAAEGTG